MSLRYWTIGLLLITGVQLANSQGIGSYGVKGGLAFSNQSIRFTPINHTLETEPILGPSLVLFMEAFRGNNFSFQTDLAFACKGSSGTIQSVTVDHLDGDRVVPNAGENYTSRHRYLSLAPMLRARSDHARFTPYAMFGPRMELLLYYSTDSKYPLEEQNGVILGLTLGIGLEYNLDRAALLVEIQFQPDLSPVTNKEPLLVNNNSLVFTIGIRWKKAQP